ncbi:MAG: oligosaccharide flippase family protein [Bacteroidetes bacterium]|nr:oligosaccharide flippase family protein [Bacteroidota bacterium]
MKKLIKNSLFGSGSFIVLSVIALVTTPFYLYKLTPEVYGIYILLTSLVGYYGLTDLGLSQGVIKFVSDNVIRDEWKQSARYINAALLIQTIIGLFITVTASFFAGEISEILRIPEIWQTEAVLGIRLCSIAFFFSMLSGTLMSVLQGLQRFEITSVAGVSLNIILNASIVMLLLLDYGLVSIIIATTLYSIVGFIFYIFIVRKENPYWRFSIMTGMKEIRALFNFSFFLFISRTSDLFASHITRYIISAFAGPVAVAIYVVPSKLITAISGVLNSGASAIMPYASEINVSEPLKIKSLFNDGTRVVAAISIPCLLFVALFSRQIITIWIEKEFAVQSWLILSILAVNGLIVVQSMVPILIIIGIGNSRTLGLFGLVSLICYLIFIPLMTHLSGPLGAASGMLIVSIIGICLVFYKTTKIVNIGIFGFIFNTFKIHFVPAFGLLVLITVLQIYYGQSICMLIIGIALFAGYYSYLIIKINEFKIISSYLFKK